MSKDKKKGKFGFLGIDPTLGLGDKVLDHVEEAQEEEKTGEEQVLCTLS
jgi:hypothetical protein